MPDPTEPKFFTQAWTHLRACPIITPPSTPAMRWSGALTEDKEDLHGKDQRCQFVTHLFEILGLNRAGNHHNTLFQLAHATAAQRAEAFGKALELW